MALFKRLREAVRKSQTGSLEEIIFTSADAPEPGATVDTYIDILRK